MRSPLTESARPEQLAPASNMATVESDRERERVQLTSCGPMAPKRAVSARVQLRPKAARETSGQRGQPEPTSSVGARKRARSHQVQLAYFLSLLA